MRKIFFLFIILSLPVFFNFRSLVKKPPQKENPSSITTAKRKSAAAPGKQVYSISQTTHSPNFTGVVIDPEDVKLGQTQTMTVTINDEKAPIKEVIAEIETDKGIIKNTLNKISGTDQNGVWQGSWIVKDTHDTTYVTTFKAVNKIGEKGEARLSWTDPGCSADANKGTSFTTTINCTITGVDGADGGTFTIAAGHTVMISAGATLVAGIFTIPTGGGTLISNSTGGINVASTNVICMNDADADNYSSATTQYLATTSCAAGQRRRNLMTSIVTLDCNDASYNTSNVCCTVATRYQDADGDTYGNPSVSISACPTAGYVDNASDCYDANANAKPGSTTCSATNRGDGSYDYNCAGGSSACGTTYYTVYSVGYCYRDVSCGGSEEAPRCCPPATQTAISSQVGCGVGGYAAGVYQWLGGDGGGCGACVGYWYGMGTLAGSYGTQACQ